jgi:hypothetical protein
LMSVFFEFGTSVPPGSQVRKQPASSAKNLMRAARSWFSFRRK